MDRDKLYYLMSEVGIDVQHQDWGDKHRPFVKHKDGTFTLRVLAEIEPDLNKFMKELREKLLTKGVSIGVFAYQQEVVFGEKIWKMTFVVHEKAQRSPIFDELENTPVGNETDVYRDAVESLPHDEFVRLHLNSPIALEDSPEGESPAVVTLPSSVPDDYDPLSEIGRPYNWTTGQWEWERV